MTRREAVHRTIVVIDIAESTDPVRTDHDRLVIRKVMYHALHAALANALGRSVVFRWHDWQRFYLEDRGDGVLILVPPDVPKARLITGLAERLETILNRHNAASAGPGDERTAATQIRLRVAVHAGEVTFDKHGVVGAAINHTFRLADAPPLRAALAKSLDPCVLIVSDWFYGNVVYHHQGARPDSYQNVDCEVKGTQLSAWLRVPEPRLTLQRTALLTATPTRQ
jgi:class 3 adenylate cyclase